jgi:potassium-transporting ATPase KdpC subunit
MKNNIYSSIIMLFSFSILLGFIYPISVVLIGEKLFPSKAQGSLLLSLDGTTIGSSLIGQSWNDPQYFSGRPSSIDYNPLSSGASQLGPINPALKIAINKNKAKRSVMASNIPAELLLASGSGLDPHISPMSALVQISRIARIRGVSEDQIKQLVILQIEKKIWGILGQDRINVLELNYKLDQIGK